MTKYIVDEHDWQELCNGIACRKCPLLDGDDCRIDKYLQKQPIYETLNKVGESRKKVTRINRLETEIENHRIRAIMSGNVGNTNESESEWYLYECLSVLKNIQDSGDCNVCASKKDCQYAPMLGQMVRYNCPFYKKEGDKECMDEDAKQASIPYSYNAPQHDWKCGYPERR